MKSVVALSVAPDLSLFHVGPALDHGPLPSLFYFALSGPDSLSLDPFDQPVRFLQGRMIRIFSLTLPGHEANLPQEKALALWAEDFVRGRDPIGEFLERAAQAVQFAIQERFVDPHRMGVAGLSRGGFIAAHLAARDSRFKFILGFAPLTQLAALEEFSGLQREGFSLEELSSLLCERHCRFYIGNRDVRVGTRFCFEFVMSLVDKAQERRIRIPQIEMIITPSIGRDGHGTAPEIFQQGTEWIARGLEGVSL